MARNPRERFERERERCRNIEDDEIADALGTQFADALDPEIVHVEIPEIDDQQPDSYSTGKNYMSTLRCAYQRGLDILDADAETVNRFMQDLVTDPDRRRYDLVDYAGTIGKPTAVSYQSALRAFFRYCTDPHATDDRPEVAVEWPAGDIIIFSERSDPKHDEDDMPEQADLDAMREACLAGQNTRRDRAFLELAAGTGQRIYALVTLRVGDVRLDADVPHVMLNPEIDGDGDKGAIENTGKRKPIVTDAGPVRQWIENHPFSDPETREEYDGPEEFEDCYLFVGSIQHWSTDPTNHWGPESARTMLARRKADTATMPGVKTVEIPVNPHNWRHYAYTKSQELSMDESTRRKVFGWAPGSDTGQTIYGHKENEKAVKEFAEAWGDEFGTDDTDAVAEQVVGDAVGGDLPPELRTELVRELIGDDTAMETIADAVVDAAE